MKRAARILGLLLTLLVLGVSISLPRLTAMFTDQNLAGAVKQIENSAVSLTLVQELELVELPELDLFPALKLFSGPRSEVELSEGRNTTRDEAMVSAMTLCELLDAVVAQPGMGLPELTPMLLTSVENPELTGIFWRCAWPKYPENFVWVDDQSGQMVCFRLSLANADLKNAAANAEAAFSVIAGYFESHYPPEIYLVHLWPSAEEIVIGKDSAIYLLRERDEGTEMIAVPMSFSEGWLAFNYLETTNTSSTADDKEYDKE